MRQRRHVTWMKLVLFTSIDLSLLNDGVALGYSIPKFKPLTPITISKEDLPDRSMWNIM